MKDKGALSDIADKKPYTGWQDWVPNDEETASFYETGKIPLEMKENEYLLIRNSEGEIVDKKCFQGGTLRSLKYTKITGTLTPSIKARNPYQELAIDMLTASNGPKVKVLRGVYGSGKDFLMLNYALSLIQKGKFSKIVYARPNITVEGLPDIGALPGTAEEKLAWTLGPFFDKVGGENGIKTLMNKGQLEIVPMLFIRGRSFEGSIVYISEGQNMTSKIAKLLLGRIGENSELWINGDSNQADKRIFDDDNGISRMVQRLAGNPLFGYVYLPITERSDVARLADKLD